MKLELGGGENFFTEGYLNVDIKEGPGVDVVGDLLALFTPDAEMSDYPLLERLDGENLFTEVRAIHFVEHIPWIYQESMFDWIWRILEPGGTLEVVTPNLEYICRVYLKRGRWRVSRFLKRAFKGVVLDLIPETDHPYIISSKNEIDLRRWFNFKTFSGCSKGDYHHCLYDTYMFKDLLSRRHAETDLPYWMHVDIKARGDMIKVSAVKLKESDKEKYF